MIRFRLSMRIIVIGMFILLYSGSLIILNQFFVEKQKESEKILSKMNISADISKIYVDTAEDSLIVNGYLQPFVPVYGWIKNDAK